MDYKNQHQLQGAFDQSGSSTVSSVENKDHREEFLDEPCQQTDIIHTDHHSRRPLHPDTPRSDDDLFANGSREILLDHYPAPDSADPSLPLMLKLLFGLNGLSLSLLTLPIMYILNTRVAVPLPYLPAYGAVAFLPYSLKPVYAYLCGLWAKQNRSETTPRTNTSNNNFESNRNLHKNLQHKHHHRYLGLFRWLLVGNSLCTLLFASIPEGGVLAVFVVSFLRGITDSWAEFCLGLTLIDHARASFSQNYESAVSSLQVQAATAGNLGAWLASLVTCVVLAWRHFATEREGGETDQQPQLTGGLTNSLVIATALIQLAGATSLHFWAKRQFNTTNGGSSGSVDGVYEELPTEAQQRTGGRETFEPGFVSTESDSLRDDENSHPSYSSLEDLAGDDVSASLSTESTSSLAHGGANTAANGLRSPTRIANWVMIVLLQLVLVAIALKQQIVEVSSHFFWVVLVTTLASGILVTALALYCKLKRSIGGNAIGDDANTLKVGIFLILKNAVPSDSAILASFFYALFGTNQPLLLQFLSFLGMGVSSLSSWSYTRLFSKRFGSGFPLAGLMAGTTALASLASLLHVSVFRVYQATNEADDESDNSDGESMLSHRLLLIAIVSKFVTTFFDEWAFLPELVLATTSVRVPTTTATTSSPADTILDHVTGNPADRAIVSGTPSDDIGGNHQHGSCNGDEDDQQQRIAMEYATLVSCIDFGDQLGSLVSAPLVAAWQISRENGFLHLDRLIVFCSVANLAITIGLLPLVWNGGSKTRR